MKDSVPINTSASASAAVTSWDADPNILAAEKVAAVAAAGDSIVTALYAPTGLPWAWLHHPLTATDAPEPSRPHFPGLSMANDVARHLLADERNGVRIRKVDAHVKEAGCVITQGVPRFLFWASRSRRDKERFAVFGIPMGIKLWSPKAAAAIPHETKVVVDIEDAATRDEVTRLLHDTDHGLALKTQKRGGP